MMTDEQMMAWLDVFVKSLELDFELKKPTKSWLYALKDKNNKLGIYWDQGTTGMNSFNAVRLNNQIQEIIKDLKNRVTEFEHSFISTINWFKFISENSQFSEGYKTKLPYEKTVFEFKISGAHVLALSEQIEDGKIQLQLFVGDPTIEEKIWTFIPEKTSHPIVGKLFNFVIQQIMSICIVLDCEIAETLILRIPHKLNNKRVKKNKVKMNDYHLVNLAKRHRYSKNEFKPETGRKVRLHFRRGHWRHFDGFKTWVKWCLVGDPDLGFVDKDYIL